MDTLWLILQVILFYIAGNIVLFYGGYIGYNIMKRWFLNKICSPGYVFKRISTRKMIGLLDKELYICQEDTSAYLNSYLTDIIDISIMEGVKRVGIIDKSELLKVVGREKDEKYREKLKNLLKYLLDNEYNPGILIRFLLLFVEKYKE